MQIEQLFNVKDQIVLITGAGGLLGSVYSNHFLLNGAKVVAIDLKKNSVIEGLESLSPDKFTFIKADITSKKAIIEALDKIKIRFGIPDVLINNAALDSPPSAPPQENGPFEDYPETSWDKVLSVNLKGVFLCCQVFGSEMAKQGRGSIINISSIYGIVSPDQKIYDYRRMRGEIFFKPIAYSASKSGLLNVTRYLATYWAGKIRVNTLTISGVFNNQEKAFIDAYCDRIPIGRMARAEEYLGAITFLACDASSYMTGSNIVVDGGWTAI
jgi:NAD(P)-dependent dehydrogenase (short-subunit alcohol dehydrogenase family)